jgi:hypothetical protein
MGGMSGTLYGETRGGRGEDVTPGSPETLFQADVESINRLDAVRTVLKVLAQATGLRTSLVARVTAESWTACAVQDGAGYGLDVGMQLDISTAF